MKASKITYERLVNTGDYSNERYGVEIILDDGDKAQDAIDKAKKLVNRQVQQPDAHARRIAKEVQEFDEDLPF